MNDLGPLSRSHGLKVYKTFKRIKKIPTCSQNRNANSKDHENKKNDYDMILLLSLFT